SLIGVRNGDATSVAIIVPPCGRCLIKGSASQPYSLFANGISASRITSTAATAFRSRSRSSIRCDRNDCSPPSVSGSAMRRRTLRLGGSRRRRCALLDVGGGAVHLAAHFGRGAARLVEVLLHVLGGELALDLALDVLPARARAAHERADRARDARQP